MHCNIIMLIFLHVITSRDVQASVKDIYTIHPYLPAVQAPHVAIYYLDTPIQLENQIFPLLSRAPDLARQQAVSLLSTTGYIQQSQQFETAYQDLISASSLGIKKIQAVVFDRRYVVYGTTDVAAALQQLASFQSKQQ